MELRNTRTISTLHIEIQNVTISNATDLLSQTPPDPGPMKGHDSDLDNVYLCATSRLGSVGHLGRVVNHTTDASMCAMKIENH